MGQGQPEKKLLRLAWDGVTEGPGMKEVVSCYWRAHSMGDNFGSWKGLAWRLSIASMDWET